MIFDNRPHDDDDDLVLNKQTNKQTNRDQLQGLINPKRPHDGFGIPTAQIGIPIPKTKAWDKLKADLLMLAARDDASLAWVGREALIEYAKRHCPGNPQLPLSNFTGKEELSEAAREKLKPAEEAYMEAEKPKLQPLPDFEKMTDQELIAFFRNPRTDYATQVIAGYEIQRRGIDLKKGVYRMLY